SACPGGRAAGRRVAALDQERREREAAEEARQAMGAARAEAEQAQARQWAGTAWAAAEGTAQEAQKALDGKRYAEAKPQFDNAQAAYKRAAAEGRRVSLLQPGQPGTASPPPTTVENEIRKAIEQYKQALETKDLTLYQQIRPGLTTREVSQIKAAFDRTLRQTVELSIESVEVKGNVAEATVRRKDVRVTTDGSETRPPPIRALF